MYGRDTELLVRVFAFSCSSRFSLAPVCRFQLAEYVDTIDRHHVLQ